MWNSKRIGNIGEAKTLSKFVELQIPVCISFGDCERYDMVAEFNGKLNKIQCKTCLNMKDEDSFEIYIINRSTKEGKDISRSYSKEDIDYFSIYNVEKDILLLYPNNEYQSTAITFRINPSKNNQVKEINFVKDYLFENIVKK